MTPDARAAALALCEEVERFFGRGQPETLPLCGCIVCQARALRAALAAVAAFREATGTKEENDVPMR